MQLDPFTFGLLTNFVSQAVWSMSALLAQKGPIDLAIERTSTLDSAHKDEIFSSLWDWCQSTQFAALIQRLKNGERPNAIEFAQEFSKFARGTFDQSMALSQFIPTLVEELTKQDPTMIAYRLEVINVEQSNQQQKSTQDLKDLMKEGVSEILQAIKQNKESGSPPDSSSDAGTKLSGRNAEQIPRSQLHGFIEAATRNVKESFRIDPSLTQRITDLVDLTFFSMKHLENAQFWYATAFFMRTHSNLLAAIRLGFSGQYPEAYNLLHGALLHALIGAHIAGNPERFLIFLKQDTDEKHRNRANQEFKRKNLLQSIYQQDAKVEQHAKKLLDTTYEYGTPGQSLELFTNVDFKSKEHWAIHYMGNSELHFATCLKTIARVQICCLLIIELVYPERFKILDISDKLKGYMQGL